MTVQCCVCKKLRIEDQWRDEPLPSEEDMVSHGYCPECASVASAELTQS